MIKDDIQSLALNNLQSVKDSRHNHHSKELNLLGTYNVSETVLNFSTWYYYPELTDSIK
jgi:hypothetical protein